MGESRVGSLLAFVLIIESFPLMHHGALAGRRYFARRAGVASVVTTSQLQLMLLQCISVGVLAVVSALRGLQGREPLPPGVLAWIIPTMVFAFGVYWRYPDAAPIAVAAPVWHAGAGRYMRWFYAGLGALFTLSSVGMGLVA